MTIVVGAGLAGLTCAKLLAEAGRPFLLLEASGRPGGRVVSDRTPEGFVLDRGFQVLLDSYPAARRHLDIAALGGGKFRAGAMFVGRGAPRTLENPLHRPSAVFAALRGDVLSWPDQWRLVRLAARSLVPFGSRDVSVEEMLQADGFSAEFFRRFARPFFGGVLLDPSLQVGGRLFLGYLRRFLTGAAVLPGDGIGALARQLADGLPEGRVRYDSPVEVLARRSGRVVGVTLRGGESLEGDAVVLATDEPSVCRLTGEGTPRQALGTAVHYFASARSFYEGAWLCLPPRREASPILHAAQVTNVARSLAPAGWHLWSVTVLPGHPQARDAEKVAAEVAGWFSAEGSELRPLDFIEVPYAVPRQEAGFRPEHTRTTTPGLILAGDAVCGASIDAVMASGEAAAKKVISTRAAN
jgi:phytoene dehydrogenase-like protein